MLDWTDRGVAMCPSLSMSPFGRMTNREIAKRVISALFKAGKQEVLSGRNHTMYDISPSKKPELTMVDQKDWDEITTLVQPLVAQLYKLCERQVGLCMCASVGVCVYGCVCGMCVYVWMCVWVCFSFCI